jgi:glutamate N-acetyltransferase/amino-acid N-acetyltransferase
MAVALSVPSVIHIVDGVELASFSANIKQADKPDLVLLKFAQGSHTAAVFTQNAFCAAPVTLAKTHLNSTEPRALLINSGNANAGTGELGLQNAESSCKAMAEQLGIDANEVLPFSTGVISQQLPMDNMLHGIKNIAYGLQTNNWLDAAQGIMTTDTLPKIISKTGVIAGTKITVTGIAKGAGMICPNMATMLSFIATDAQVEPNDLQACLSESVLDTFNAISIDGDTSTNDACTLTATGKAGGELLSAAHSAWPNFKSLINEVCALLAQSIVRDGEGATKFITLNVKEGRNKQECKEVAYTLAHSPLVKTAFYASDANIGRLLAAVGRSKIDNLNISSVNISLDEVDIIVNGLPASSYTEERGQMVMSREEISVTIFLGRGDASCTVWTCDLSLDYVRINADYRS